MREVMVWDRFIRWFHWLLVGGVFINVVLIDEGLIHEMLGYFIGVLLLFRIVWGFIGTRHARFVNFFPTIARLRHHLSRKLDEEEVCVGHNPVGALMIFNLFGALTALILTGYLMTTEMFWGSDFMEDVHEGLVVYLLISIALHVTGVVIESFRGGINLISAMVTGKKILH